MRTVQDARTAQRPRSLGTGAMGVRAGALGAVRVRHMGRAVIVAAIAHGAIDVSLIPRLYHAPETRGDDGIGDLPTRPRVDARTPEDVL